VPKQKKVLVRRCRRLAQMARDLARPSPHARPICGHLRHLRTKCLIVKPGGAGDPRDKPEGDGTTDTGLTAMRGLAPVILKAF
jgi:hypothetical protein